MIKVLDFSAAWCGPCKMQGPIFESASANLTTEDIQFEKIDIDSNPDMAAKYSIRAVPTMIFEIDGDVVYRKSGIMTETDIATKINELILS